MVGDVRPGGSRLVPAALAFGAALTAVAAFALVAAGAAEDVPFLVALLSPIVGIPFAVLATLAGERRLGLLALCLNALIALALWRLGGLS